MTALHVSDLSVELGGKPIVKSVSLAVEPGEWCTIIGPNGAGKSTMLNAIAGLLPSAGGISYRGRPFANISRRQRAREVAVVAQNPTVPPGMSVFDYVLLGRNPHVPPLGRESANDLEVAWDVCKRLSLVEFARRDLETLSGGERQRAFLARALTQLSGTEYGLLLLDEPTSALDIGHQQEVLDLVDDLRCDADLTVITSMHELSVAGEYADRLLLLVDGERVAYGPPSEVLTQELISRHYKARVNVVETPDGPVVVPVRRWRSGSRGDVD